MLLIFGNPDAMASLPEGEVEEIHAAVDRRIEALRASGEFVAGHGLALPSTARTVRKRDGVVVATDGPFAESKEQFGGYLMVDVESVERAVEIASEWPGLGHTAIEVREVTGSASE